MLVYSMCRLWFSDSRCLCFSNTCRRTTTLRENVSASKRQAPGVDWRANQSVLDASVNGDIWTPVMMTCGHRPGGTGWGWPVRWRDESRTVSVLLLALRLFSQSARGPRWMHAVGDPLSHRAIEAAAAAVRKRPTDGRTYKFCGEAKRREIDTPRGSPERRSVGHYSTDSVIRLAVRLGDEVARSVNVSNQICQRRYSSDD